MLIITAAQPIEKSVPQNRNQRMLGSRPCHTISATPRISQKIAMKRRLDLLIDSSFPGQPS
jgi:hypothetical protein